MTIYITHNCKQNNLYTDALITDQSGRSKDKHFLPLSPCSCKQPDLSSLTHAAWNLTHSGGTLFIFWSNWTLGRGSSRVKDALGRNLLNCCQELKLKVIFISICFSVVQNASPVYPLFNSITSQHRCR